MNTVTASACCTGASRPSGRSQKTRATPAAATRRARLPSARRLSREDSATDTMAVGDGNRGHGANGNAQSNGLRKVAAELWPSQLRTRKRWASEVTSGFHFLSDLSLSIQNVDANL